MPNYQVTAPGFYYGRLYGPNTKREVLAVDRPFGGPESKNPKPSWCGDEVEVVAVEEVENEGGGTETLTGEGFDSAVASDAAGKPGIVQRTIDKLTGSGEDFSGSSDVINSEDAQVNKPESSVTETL